MISDEALAIARERAAQDQETLVRLLREGRVVRDFSTTPGVDGAREFQVKIESMVRPTVNTAIRPRKRRRR